MDTCSDSDGTLSPGGGVYGQVPYATAVTGYEGPMIKSSPSRHSESSGGSGSVDEPCTKAHHKFSIDRILGRFGGGSATDATATGSCGPETSDPGKSHQNELPLRGAGE